MKSLYHREFMFYAGYIHVSWSACVPCRCHIVRSCHTRGIEFAQAIHVLWIVHLPCTCYGLCTCHGVSTYHVRAYLTQRSSLLYHICKSLTIFYSHDHRFFIYSHSPLQIEPMNFLNHIIRSSCMIPYLYGHTLVRYNMIEDITCLVLKFPSSLQQHVCSRACFNVLSVHVFTSKLSAMWREVVILFTTLFMDNIFLCRSYDAYDLQIYNLSTVLFQMYCWNHGSLIHVYGTTQ